jgi:hypothetical protein
MLCTVSLPTHVHSAIKALQSFVEQYLYMNREGEGVQSDDLN